MPPAEPEDAAVDDDLTVVHRGDSVAIIGCLDRRTAEALSLELRAVAKRHGLTLRPLQVLPADPAAAPSGGPALGSAG
jgi:hypothetical protein